MPSMGRPKTVNKDSFERLFPRHGKKGTTWYYLGYTPEGKRVWTNLGKDRLKALEEYARLEGKQAQPVQMPENIVSELIKRYKREIYPTKSAATQFDNDREFKQLEPVFGKMAIESIKPIHIRKYLDARTAKIRANREISLLSHLFNCARDWGITDMPNPCSGVRRNKETGRDIYVFDEDFRAVYEKAEFPLQDAMDLYLLLGQRVSDVTKLSRTDIKDGRLWIRQNKTGKLVGVEIVGELAVVLERIKNRPGKAGVVQSLHLLRDADGNALTYSQMRRMFDQAREKAGVTFQLRDLRAKSATDEESLATANERLGHSTMTMTKHYRRATKVGPLR